MMKRSALILLWLCIPALSHLAAQTQDNAYYRTVALKALIEVSCARTGHEVSDFATIEVPPEIIDPKQITLFTSLQRFADDPFDDSANDNIRSATYNQILALVKLMDTTRVIVTLQGEPSVEALAQHVSAAREIVAKIEVNTTHGAEPIGVTVPFEQRVLEGLASFIADRFKQEIALTFFSRFRERLENSDMKVLLPNTQQCLASLADNPLSIPSMGDMWKSAFQTDLYALPANTSAFMRSRAGLDTATSHYSDGVRVFVDALTAFDMIHRGDHPFNILHAFRLTTDGQRDIRASVDVNFTELQNAVRLLDHVSQNLLNPEGNGWVSARDFDVLNDQKTFETFIGFLYAVDGTYRNKAGDVVYAHDIFNRIPIGNGRSVDLAFLKEGIQSLRPRLEEFRMVVGLADTKIKQIRDLIASGGRPTLDDYLSYTQTVFDLIKFGYRLSKMVSRKNLDESYFTQTLIPIGEAVLRATRNVQQGNYGGILSETFVVIGLIQQQQKDAVLGKQEVLYLMKYGSFIVDVVNSQSPEEVQQALEAAALPVGSYSVERTVPLYVGINTFPGLVAGQEALLPSATNKTTAFGVSAPVGINIGTSRNGWSFSLFAPIIDLGALVNYRLKSGDADSVSQLPVIGFQQVFSPGIFVQVGFPKSPFQIAFGAQLSPQLRRVQVVTTDQGGNVVQSEIRKDAFRVGVSVSVDIPLFHLYAGTDGVVE